MKDNIIIIFYFKYYVYYIRNIQSILMAGTLIITQKINHDKLKYCCNYTFELN